MCSTVFGLHFGSAENQVFFRARIWASKGGAGNLGLLSRLLEEVEGKCIHLFQISASLSGCTCKFVNFAYRWLHRCYNGRYFEPFTGADTIPPLGLGDATLSFNHTYPYPTASTCALCLTLPTMYSKDYMNFKKILHVCSCSTTVVVDYISCETVSLPFLLQQPCSVIAYFIKCDHILFCASKSKK